MSRVCGGGSRTFSGTSDASVGTDVVVRTVTILALIRL